MWFSCAAERCLCVCGTGWARSGWPDWAIYRPIAEAAFRHGLTLRAGDAARAKIRAVADRGISELDAGERSRLALDQPLEANFATALKQEIKVAHCDLLPDAAIGPMLQVQQFRDATLAAALVSAAGAAGAVLIAGNGHIRSDWAVPWYLQRTDEAARVVSVMLVELQEAADLDDLITRDANGLPVADYFWLTPRVDREDQCEKLRRRMGG